MVSFRRKPESSIFRALRIDWTPVFTGVTTKIQFFHSFSEVTGGGWTRVVLSEPLNGDFQEGIVIGRMELQARSEASSVWGINAER
jgi:hypothetical protein